MAIFISIEGADCVGKSTQAISLSTKLSMDGYKVKIQHFPRYEGPIGSLIKNVLFGKETVDPVALQRLYMADQIDYSNRQKALDDADYDYVILDRYYLSTKVYSMAGTGIDKFSRKMREIQDDLDICQYAIAKPDVELIFYMETEALLERLKRKSFADHFETQLGFMIGVNDIYRMAPVLGISYATSQIMYNSTDVRIDCLSEKIYTDIVELRD